MFHFKKTFDLGQKKNRIRCRSHGWILVSRYRDLGLRSWKMRSGRETVYSNNYGIKLGVVDIQQLACLIFKTIPRCQVIRVNFSIPYQTFMDLTIFCTDIYDVFIKIFIV